MKPTRNLIASEPTHKLGSHASSKEIIDYFSRVCLNNEISLQGRFSLPYSSSLIGAFVRLCTPHPAAITKMYEWNVSVWKMILIYSFFLAK